MMKSRVLPKKLLHFTKWFNSFGGNRPFLIYHAWRIKTGFFLFLFTLYYNLNNAQCDSEASGVFTYCNAVGTPGSTGYFVAFRVKDITGDTLNVVDLNGNNVMNRGKRIDDINTQEEPPTVTIAPVMISGVGADTLEFWYFGPFPNGSSFNIVLIDPNNECDTLFVAAGSYDCMDSTPISDPGACENDVPLFFLDFSQTEFTYGGGGGGNENIDAFFLIMQRSRENVCCDVEPGNQKCFEFIIRLGENDIGLEIDDVGSGATAGEFYADTLNGFMCTGISAQTWPFTQSGGQSSDYPLCLNGFGGQEFVVLSCKSGNNVTGVSMTGISDIFAPPRYTMEDCEVDLKVYNVDSAFWTSEDDPNLDNFRNCQPDSVFCTFLYDSLTFGEITECDGDTFVYIVGGIPGHGCVIGGTIVYDTTFVVVYPSFEVTIDSICNITNDSILLVANITGSGADCDLEINWSTGDTSTSIVVPNASGHYSVTVRRSDLDSNVVNCSRKSDAINVETTFVHCDNISDVISNCIEALPPANPAIIEAGGCGTDPLIYAKDVSNGGSGCQSDLLIITRYYIVDFDGDTLLTQDRDTCIQLFTYVDNLPPIIGCPSNITIQCHESTLPPATGGPPTVIDNCDPAPALSSFLDVITPGNCPQEYTIARTWWATDACGNSASCRQTIVVEDTNAPVISCPPNVTIQCNESTLPSNTGFAEATDNCDLTPAITYSDLVSNSPVCTLVRTWRATDDCGNSTSCVQIIVLEDNTPPVLSCPPDITIQCTSLTTPAITGFATANDNCDVSITPVILSNNVVTGSCPQQLIITRIWQATDDCGNASTCSQIITRVDDVPPVILCPPDMTVQCAALIPNPALLNIVATDNCDDMPVKMHVSDIISGQSCNNRFILSRTYRATDACGNSSTCVQMITVFDNTSPVLTCPGNIIIDCNASTEPVHTGFATATDNCNFPAIVNFSDVTIASTSCSQEYTIFRTWRAEDNCGNSSTCQQVITINDLIPPVISCPADITILFPANTLPVNTGTATATDNCDTDPGITFTDDISESCVEENFITRTWFATDECGNSSSCQQRILIDDLGDICGRVEDQSGEPISNVTIQLIEDRNENEIYDAGDTLIETVLTTNGTGTYCFNDLRPCHYLIIEVQPVLFTDLFDYDFTPDPDGMDSLGGPNNQIPVVLAQDESDNDNNFIEFECPSVLPVIPSDTICDGESVMFETSPLNPGELSYSWNFGSGSSPLSAIGLGPHTVSYDTTESNQTTGASIILTVSMQGCPDLVGQVSTVIVNPYPDPAINGSTQNFCYYTYRTFQPASPPLAGAIYNWTFGYGAVPATAVGYGPHTVYYDTSGMKSVTLVINSNAPGSDCIDSATINFTVLNCPSSIAGRVRSTSGTGIQGATIRLYTDNDLDGIADNSIYVRSVNSTASGSFTMTGLIPGSYVIVETQPPLWYNFDDRDTSHDGDLVLNIDSLDNLIPTTLYPGEIDAHNFFTEIALPGGIQGAVFRDIDHDELPDSDEGIASVLVKLHADVNKDGRADEGPPLDSVMTSNTGSYQFLDVPIGNYVLVQVPLEGFESIKDYDLTNDLDSVPNTNMNNDTLPVTIINEENDQHNYFIKDYDCSGVVNSLEDDGQGTLRFMIGCAEEGDTIRFDSSIAGDTIMISSQTIEINKDLTIESNLVPNVLITSSIPGIFEIHANSIVEFRNIYILSGISGGQGAAFYNSGTLKLTNTTVMRNPELLPGEFLIFNSMTSQVIFSGNTYLMMN